MKHPPQERDLVPGRTIGAVAAGVIAATIGGAYAAYAIGSCDVDELAIQRTSPHVRGEVNAMETLPFQVEAQGLEDRRRAAAYLSSYGWIDRERGLVRIPIEAAFQVLLTRRGGRP